MASEADRQAAVYLYRRIRQKSILRPMPSEMESMIADAIAEARAEGYRAGLEAAAEIAREQTKKQSGGMSTPVPFNWRMAAQYIEDVIRALINSTDSPAGETGRGEA